MQNIENHTEFKQKPVTRSAVGETLSPERKFKITFLWENPEKATISDFIYQYPKFLNEAFSSQAHNLIHKLSLAEKQKLCFLEMIASYILKDEAICFTSTNKKLARFNLFSEKYKIKTIKERTFYKIQKLLLNENLIYTKERDPYSVGFLINLEQLNIIYPSIINLALSHAKRKISSIYHKMQSCRLVVDKSTQASNSKALETVTTEKNADIRMNNEKNNKENKQKSENFLNFEIIKRDFVQYNDAKEILELRFKLKEALKYEKQYQYIKFNSENACRMLELHSKYKNAYLSDKIKSLCNAIICNSRKEQELFNSKKEKPAPVIKPAPAAPQINEEQLKASGDINFLTMLIKFNPKELIKHKALLIKYPQLINNNIEIIKSFIPELIN